MEYPGYKLLGIIAEGGMATVYRGVQLSLNRTIAVKVLKPDLIDQSEVKTSFERESLIIAKLHHPHIIHVIDKGINEDNMPYFVMEFIDGQSLARAIRQGALNFAKKLDILIQVCKALSYAHKNGIIHRDIKPDNILLDQDQDARILDFGIAQFMRKSGQEDNQNQMVMGTLVYMSPEQQTPGAPISFLSDLYSLGVMMYEMFTGKKPLTPFIPAKNLAPIPDELNALIERCLEKDPLKRPASADEIKDTLLHLARGVHIGATQKQLANQGVRPDAFELLDVIKEGKFSSVHLFEKKSDGSLLVIKKRPLSMSGFYEAKLLANLKHDNIVNIFGTSSNKRHFIVVMEYLTGGSLQERLLQAVSLADFLPTARQICSALAFAHQNNVIHGNLRPSNILFDHFNQVKITDFGLQGHYEEQPNEDQNWYNVHNERKTPALDMFACGVIFYQMLTALLPCWNSQKKTVQQMEHLPQSLQDMLIEMLSPIATRRPQDFETILQHLEDIDGNDVGTQIFESQTVAKTTFYSEEPTKTKAKVPLWLKIIATVLLLNGLLGLGYLFTH